MLDEGKLGFGIAQVIWRVGSLAVRVRIQKLGFGGLKEFRVAAGLGCGDMDFALTPPVSKAK